MQRIQTTTHKQHTTIDPFSRTGNSALFQQANKSMLEMYRTKYSGETIDRPHTSFFLTHKFNQGKPKRIEFVGQSEIQIAEHDLEKMFKVNLSTYLHKKFRNFIIRKKDTVSPEPEEFKAQHNPEMLNSFCSRMKISIDQDRQEPQLQSRVKHGNIKVIESAYLVNAKERISRLISMKIESQQMQKEISETIRQKQRMKEQAMKRQGRMLFLMKDTKETIQEKEWDRQWKSQYVNQIKRYKTRLVSRAIDKSKKKE